VVFVGVSFVAGNSSAEPNESAGLFVHPSAIPVSFPLESVAISSDPLSVGVLPFGLYSLFISVLLSVLVSEFVPVERVCISHVVGQLISALNPVPDGYIVLNTK